MSQANNKYPLGATLSGTTYTQDLNIILGAIDSANSGELPPTNNLVEGKLWLDTSSPATPVLKIYDASAGEFIVLGEDGNVFRTVRIYQNASTAPAKPTNSDTFINNGDPDDLTSTAGWKLAQETPGSGSNTYTSIATFIQTAGTGDFSILAASWAATSQLSGNTGTTGVRGPVIGFYVPMITRNTVPDPDTFAATPLANFNPNDLVSSNVISTVTDNQKYLDTSFSQHFFGNLDIAAVEGDYGVFYNGGIATGTCIYDTSGSVVADGAAFEASETTDISMAQCQLNRNANTGNTTDLVTGDFLLDAPQNIIASYDAASGHWITAVQEIAGNLIVTGSITADAIDADAIRGKTVSGGGKVDAEDTTRDGFFFDSDGTFIIGGTSGNLAFDGEDLTVPALTITGELGSTQIADGAITTDKIQAGAITATEIQADSITADKLASISLSVEKNITVGNITATGSGITELSVEATTPQGFIIVDSVVGFPDKGTVLLTSGSTTERFTYDSKRESDPTMSITAALLSSGNSLATASFPIGTSVVGVEARTELKVETVIGVSTISVDSVLEFPEDEGTVLLDGGERFNYDSVDRTLKTFSSTTDSIDSIFAVDIPVTGAYEVTSGTGVVLEGLGRFSVGTTGNSMTFDGTTLTISGVDLDANDLENIGALDGQISASLQSYADNTAYEEGDTVVDDKKIWRVKNISTSVTEDTTLASTVIKANTALFPTSGAITIGNIEFIYGSKTSSQFADLTPSPVGVVLVVGTGILRSVASNNTTDPEGSESSPWEEISPDTDTTYSNFGGANGSTAGSSGLVNAPVATDNVNFLRGDGSWALPTDTDTDTTYSNFGGANGSTAGSSGLVNAPVATDNVNFLRGDGSWALPTDTDTTYSNFGGANGSTAGSSGLVNAPVATDNVNFLRGDGSWALPTDTDTTYSNFGGANGSTAGSSGLVNAPVATDNVNFLRGDGSWALPTDTDTTYSNFGGANGSTAGSSGLVNAPVATDNVNFLRGDGSWALPTDTDTTYSNFGGANGSTAGSSGLVNAPVATDNVNFLRGDGSWALPTDTDTTYSNFGGANGSTAGSSGLVNAPVATDNVNFLRGDGSWALPTDTDTTYSNFGGANGSTAGSSGLVNAPVATDNVNFLRGDGSWALPTDTDTTDNESISLSGDATGSGATSITVAIGKGKIEGHANDDLSEETDVEIKFGTIGTPDLRNGAVNNAKLGVGQVSLDKMVIAEFPTVVWKTAYTTRNSSPASNGNWQAYENSGLTDTADNNEAWVDINGIKLFDTDISGRNIANLINALEPGSYIRIGQDGTTTAATAIVAGNSYKILTIGNTDFTAIGSADNNVGTTFIANDVGTGTGTTTLNRFGVFKIIATPAAGTGSRSILFASSFQSSGTYSTTSATSVDFQVKTDAIVDGNLVVTGTLKASDITTDNLTATNITAVNATFSNLVAEYAKIDKIEADKIDTNILNAGAVIVGRSLQVGTFVDGFEVGDTITSGDSGFFVDSDGDMVVGTENNYVEWFNNVLTVRGSLNAGDITAGSLSSSRLTIDGNLSITPPTDNDDHSIQAWSDSTDSTPVIRDWLPLAQSTVPVSNALDDTRGVTLTGGGQSGFFLGQTIDGPRFFLGKADGVNSKFMKWTGDELVISGDSLTLIRPFPAFYNRHQPSTGQINTTFPGDAFFACKTTNTTPDNARRSIVSGTGSVTVITTSVKTIIVSNVDMTGEDLDGGLYDVLRSGDTCRVSSRALGNENQIFELELTLDPVRVNEAGAASATGDFTFLSVNLTRATGSPTSLSISPAVFGAVVVDFAWRYYVGETAGIAVDNLTDGNSYASNMSIGKLSGTGGVDGNTYVGFKAASKSSTRVRRSTAVGAEALSAFVASTSDADGQGDNTAVGAQAGVSVLGINNTLIGSGAGEDLVGETTLTPFKASRNTLIGYRSGGNLVDQKLNVMIGNEAGISLASGEEGDGSVFIGANTDISGTDGHAAVAIGYETEANEFSIAVGAYALALGQESIAIGSDGGSFPTSLPTSNTQGARARAPRSIAIGNTAQVPTEGFDSIAIGTNSSAGGVGDGVVDATDAVAIGNSAKAAGEGSIAIGGGSSSDDQVVASGKGSIVIGTSAGNINALSTATNNIIMGPAAGGTLTSGKQNVFIGSNAGELVGDGDNNVSIGNGAGLSTDTEDSVAIGQAAKAEGDNSVAIGRISRADGLSSTALGTSTDATGASSVAVGDGSEAGKVGTEAALFFHDLGGGFLPGGDWRFAAGSTITTPDNVTTLTGWATGAHTLYLSNLSGSGESSIGQSNSVDNRTLFDGMPIGQICRFSTSQTGKTAGFVEFILTSEPVYKFDNNSSFVNPISSDNNEVWIMNINVTSVPSALASGLTTASSGVTFDFLSGEDATAIGKGAQAIGRLSIAIGGPDPTDSNSPTASGVSSIAIGPGATASGNDAVVIGLIANANVDGATAVGSQSTVSGLAGTAVGALSVAGTNSFGSAFGILANASGLNSTAIGSFSTATQTSATAIGTGANATALSTTALGNSAQATGSNSTALGTGALSSGINSTAIGNGARLVADPLFTIFETQLDDSGNIDGAGRWRLKTGTVNTSLTANNTTGLTASLTSNVTQIFIASQGTESLISSNNDTGALAKLLEMRNVSSGDSFILTLPADRATDLSEDSSIILTLDADPSYETFASITDPGDVVNNGVWRLQVTITDAQLISAFGTDFLTIDTGFNEGVSFGFGSGPTDNKITLGNGFITGLNCNVQSISSLSDERDKANIVDLSEEDGLDFINDLRPRTFNWDRRSWYDDGVPDGSMIELTRSESVPNSGKQMGFIAQEVEAVIGDIQCLGDSNLVTGNAYQKQMAYAELITPMVKAIQQLSTENDALKARLDALEDL